MIDNSVSLEGTPAYPFTHKPGTVLGYRENGKPIYNIAGGSVDVTADSEADDDDDTDEDDSEEAEDEWVPPTKEEFEKILAAKQKADSEAAARKRFLREAGLDPKTGKAVAKPKLTLDEFDEDDEDDSDEEEPVAKKPNKGESRTRNNKAFERQLEREIAKTERRVRDESAILMSAVPEALNEAGWNGKNLPRMLKLLDLDEIHVDTDGEVDGLTDQIAELKADFPEFFKRTRMKEAVKEVADTKTVGGGRKKAPAAETNLDWTERLKQELYRQ